MNGVMLTDQESVTLLCNVALLMASAFIVGYLLGGYRAKKLAEKERKP